MCRNALLALVAVVTMLSLGCSSDSDSSSRDKGVRDSSVDSSNRDGLPPDVSVDGGPPIADQGVPPDQTVDADGAGDAAGDAAADAVVDAPSAAPLWGYVSRSVAPVLDAKGTLYVALLVTGMPMHQAQVQADLSAVGSQVIYEIWGAPAGTFALTAFLDDNGNAFPVLPFPDPGDLTLSSLPQVTVVAGGSQQKDLVLDKVEGGAAVDAGLGDAALSIGAVKGKITSTAAAALDAKGTLHISLHLEPPPAGLIAATTVNSADLSSPFASEAFFLGGVVAGKYYLRVFLDDNANVGPFGAEPDKGDLVHSKLIQVHVVGGATNVQDVVLDSVAK